eukprot:PhM_4_TR2009/c0_g2_i1/m.2992
MTVTSTSFVIILLLFCFCIFLNFKSLALLLLGTARRRTEGQDASGRELVDLRRDVGVGQVLLGAGGVHGQLAQNKLHVRVPEDLLDLGVLLRAGHALLVDLARLHRLHDLRTRAHDARLALLVLGVDLEPGLVLLHGPVVLLAEEVAVGLAHDCLQEGGIDGEALVAVLHGVVVRAQLHVRRRAVRVHDVVAGVALDGLGVLADGLREALLAEVRVAALLRLERELGAVVRLHLVLLLRGLALVEESQRAGVAVLHERLLVQINRVRELLAVLQHLCLARHQLRQHDVVVDELALLVHVERVPDDLHDLVHVAHLEVHGRLIQVEGALLGVQRDGLVVGLERVLELALLVVRVAALL